MVDSGFVKDRYGDLQNKPQNVANFLQIHNRLSRTNRHSQKNRLGSLSLATLSSRNDDDGKEIGKELFIQKSQGYVSSEEYEAIKNLTLRLEERLSKLESLLEESKPK